MACIRKRRGKYVVDYRDSLGNRHWATCRTRDEADDVLASKIRESRQAIRPTFDPRITLAEYATQWLKQIESGLKTRTFRGYQDKLRLHILPALGKLKIAAIHKGRVKALLTAKLATGLSHDTIRLIHATLRVMLNAAVEDGLILANPAEKLGRSLRFVRTQRHRQERIKAFSREQLEVFLEAARHREARFAPLFLLLARAGLRLGEALAVQWTISISYNASSTSSARSPQPAKSNHRSRGTAARSTCPSNSSRRSVNSMSNESRVTPTGLARGPALGLLLDRRHALRPRQDQQGLQARIKGGGPTGTLHPARPPTHVRLAAPPTGRVASLRAAPTRPRVDPTHRRHLRQVAPMGNKAAVDRLDSTPVSEPSGSKVVATGGGGGDDDPASPWKTKRARRGSNSRPTDSKSAALSS